MPWLKHLADVVTTLLCRSEKNSWHPKYATYMQVRPFTFLPGAARDEVPPLGGASTRMKETLSSSTGTLFLHRQETSSCSYSCSYGLHVFNLRHGGNIQHLVLSMLST
jgi:hypothetical protein